MSGVQSIERAFAVLRCLASGPAGVTDLATRVDLPKSTVSRLLSTLESLGAVTQVSAGGPYRLGEGMIEIAAAVSPGRNIVGIVRPFLTEVVEATGEAAGLSVADGGQVHYLAQVESSNPVQVRDWTGERVDLHVVSSGLVLLAWAGKVAIDRYLKGPLERFTPASIVSPSAIRRRLEQVRDDGFAWVHGEFAEGINSVAAPIRDAHGIVIAALHAHGPAYRFPAAGADTDISRVVVAAADRVSAHLSNRR